MVTPTKVIVPKASTKVVRGGRLSIFRWLLKNWYYIAIIIFLIPNIILSFQISKDTNNPTYPFVALGLSVINADSTLNDYVTLLEEDPKSLIGIKPEKGIFQKTKYFLKVLLVVWAILGLVLLITLPFTIIYRIVLPRNTSEKWKAWGKTFLIGFLVILFVNLLRIIVIQAGGDAIYSFDESLDFFGKAKLVLFWVIPFHGFVHLLMYLINLI